MNNVNSNYNNNIKNQINTHEYAVSLKNLHEGNESSYKMLTLDMPSEDIFIYQKEEIKKIKKKNAILKKNYFSYKSSLNNKNFKIRRNTISGNTILPKLPNNGNSFSISNNNTNNTNTNISTNNNKNYNISNKNKNLESKTLTNSFIDDQSSNNPHVNNRLQTKIFLSNCNSKRLLYYSFVNYKNFQISKISYNNKNKEEDNNIPKITEKWKELDLATTNSFYNNNSLHINFQNLALRTKNEINYINSGIELNINVNLYGESELWISTRSFIGKENLINTSLSNLYTGPKDMFNKYSNLIKINKICNSNKAFVSFGTFYENVQNGEMYYKTFLKRQLIDFQNDENNYYYLENDLCELNIIITDLGTENLEAKISLNNKDEFNNIRGSFYLPFNGKAKLFLCGIGEKILVTGIKIKNFKNDDEEDYSEDRTILTSKRDNCDCCYIF